MQSRRARRSLRKANRWSRRLSRAVSGGLARVRKRFYLVYPAGIGESKLTHALIEKKTWATRDGAEWEYGAEAGGSEPRMTIGAFSRRKSDLKPALPAAAEVRSWQAVPSRQFSCIVDLSPLVSVVGAQLQMSG